MLQDLFGHWCTGRIGPRRFAVLWATLVVTLAALTFLFFAAAIGIVVLVKADGTPGRGVLAAVAAFGGILLFLAAMFNITIKRGRDIGIPGFVTAIACLVLLPIGGLSIFATILLALVPGNSLSRSSA